MTSFRALPRVGDRATMVRMGMAREVEIVAVAGPSVEVVDADGEATRFALSPLTGHWVREGDPYYGVRLVLGGPG